MAIASLPPGGGLLLVDKPSGCTSHDVVGRLRRVLGTRRIGHAGTLDPMATGLLVVAVERSTKLLGHLALTDKTYLATIFLGRSTTTDDAEGETVVTAPAETVAAVSDDDIAREVGRLTGRILQVPSSVSAIKVDGKRAYDLVRAGETVELAARPVTVTRFDILGPVRRDVHRASGATGDVHRASGATGDVHRASGATGDVRASGAQGEASGGIQLDVLVECTTGTYIRSLARDLGAALKIGGHLTALRRTAVGPFVIGDAIDVYGPEGVPQRGGPRVEVGAEFSDAVAAAVVPAATAVREAFPVREIDAVLAKDMRYGRPVPAAGLDGVYGLFHEDALLALVEESDGMARPRLVWDPAG